MPVNKNMKQNKINNDELIKIFPEAKKIIFLKIEELEKERHLMVKLIKKELKCIKNISDEVSQFIYREIVKIWHIGRLREIESHILKLKIMIKANNSKKKNKKWITEKQIQNVLQIPIESLINWPLRKCGIDFIGLCPFHKEKNPSFHIYTETNSFYCFGCGKGGNVINFIRILHGYSFPEAVNHLLKK